MNDMETLKQQNKKLLVELFSICMDIHYGETDHAVFFNVSGHVDNIEIRVCESRDKYTNDKTFARFYRLAADPAITNIVDLKDMNENIERLIIEIEDFYNNRKVWFSDMGNSVKLDIEVLRKKKKERLCLLPSGKTLWINDKKADFKKNNITSTKRFATDNGIPYSE